MVRTGTINKLQDLRQKIYVAAKSNKQVMAGRNGVVRWYTSNGDYIMITKSDTMERK
jgi:uncharacterized protein YaiL (DUF2058 family)